MTKPQRITGVLSPVVTPFKRDLSTDADRFVRHCRWLLAHGCAGLAVFGTNSEANSMSVDEKLELLEALIKKGIPAVAVLSPQGQLIYATEGGELADARKMGDQGVYDFFTRIAAKTP